MSYWAANSLIDVIMFSLEPRKESLEQLISSRCLLVLWRLSKDAILYLIEEFLLIIRQVELRHYIVLVISHTLRREFDIFKGVLSLVFFQKWLLLFDLRLANRIECAVLGRYQVSPRLTL